MLKPINAAAGSTMANSNVSSVRVRSVKRHFLGMFCFVKLMPRWKTQLRIWNIKTRERACVKPKQTIVKSCEEKRGKLTPCGRVYCGDSIALFVTLCETCAGVGSCERSHPPPSASINWTDAVIAWVRKLASCC